MVAVLLAASSLLLLPGSHAFVHPVMQSSAVVTSTTSLSALPEFNPFLLADGLSAATRYGGSGFDNDVFADPAVTSALSTLRTFFIVLTAAAFGLTALAYITAAFIVPKAAEQLENDTKRLRPGLWEEYEAKLEDNQTMANRPDLLQELGNIMQPIITAEYERQAEEKFGPKAGAKKEDGGVIDVEVEDK
mmetsp:Transcript_1019/g.2137  ORF Transcript_1019/g.2137 Transcript_1019/m.2137 type:complete len:190 (-) Transcript_1019:190-759(-)|eukprot:CAMPEP_0113372538 /NCGR_PEP_ID=MMETSP0013_2-20120614/589_1 /TAXON_ID=2843 ORGANISM="Skeletonema costatum, Strain 1716" /NCGR_SAMPLE_ID=MMETSP0013_2 /ASSEMBLY_ACC=CAM_ASM_000158 /LENGTH=189 /DNA_ID=CAMNT_0000254439 /DNA_START=44 /DNA_END=613 /DNA_ORIENTATION=+ /assembly_acc=CAM_ASM_000158